MNRQKDSLPSILAIRPCVRGVKQPTDSGKVVGTRGTCYTLRKKSGFVAIMVDIFIAIATVEIKVMKIDCNLASLEHMFEKCICACPALNPSSRYLLEKLANI